MPSEPRDPRAASGVTWITGSPESLLNGALGLCPALPSCLAAAEVSLLVSPASPWAFVLQKRFIFLFVPLCSEPSCENCRKINILSHLCTWSSQECSHHYAMGQPPVLIGTANCISPVFHQLYCIKARQPTASSLASQTSWNPCAQHQRAEHYRQQKNPVGISSLLGCTTLPSNFCFFKYLWVAHILGSKVNGGTPQRTAFRDQGELCWKSTSTAEPIEKDIQPAGLGAWRKGRQSWSSHGGSIVWIPGSVILLQLPTALPSEGPAFFPAHPGAHLITAF